MNRTALELIGQSGLGCSFDSLTEDVPHPYSIAAKSFSYVDFPGITARYSIADKHTRPTLFKMTFSRAYLLAPSLKIGTPKFRRFVMNLLPWKNLHGMRDIVDVLTRTAVDIFEEKKQALEKGDDVVTQQIDKGKDIISILSAYQSRFLDIIVVDAFASCVVRANMSASEEDKLSEEELLGQVS